MIKKNGFTIIYSVTLITYTIYILLDTFIISQVYDTVDNSQTSMIIINDNENVLEKGDFINNSVGINNTKSKDKKEIISTSNLYEDENIKIKIKEYNIENTQVYVADINIKNATLLKTAFANNSYGKNITAKTSTIANSLNAILAINGDYYGVQEKGYVLKNGVIYRDTAVKNKEDLVIYKDGTFEIINESEKDIYDLLNNGACNILSFGPSLVNNREISINKNYEVVRSMASNPRTAIGIIDDLHYAFVVSDGRTSNSEGITLYELASFMKNELGAETAYNLDGGGSSTMYFNGEIINNPTTNGKKISERSVSDIVYIGY